jgi:hypothetical protein
MYRTGFALGRQREAIAVAVFGHLPEDKRADGELSLWVNVDSLNEEWTL